MAIETGFIAAIKLFIEHRFFIEDLQTILKYVYAKTDFGSITHYPSQIQGVIESIIGQTTIEEPQEPDNAIIDVFFETGYMLISSSIYGQYELAELSLTIAPDAVNTPLCKKYNPLAKALYNHYFPGRIAPLSLIRQMIHLDTSSELLNMSGPMNPLQFLIYNQIKYATTPISDELKAFTEYFLSTVKIDPYATFNYVLNDDARYRTTILGFAILIENIELIHFLIESSVSVDSHAYDLIEFLPEPCLPDSRCLKLPSVDLDDPANHFSVERALRVHGCFPPFAHLF